MHLEEEGDTTIEKTSKMLEALRACLTTEQCTKQSYISPLEVREQIRGLWKNQPSLMSALFGNQQQSSSSSGDMFLLDVVPVPPSRFRPVSKHKKFICAVFICMCVIFM